MITLANPVETRRFGKDVAASLKAGDAVALVGELGAGKTEVAKGIAVGLDYGGEVTSPTFTLMHEYRGGRLTIFHFDFYRIESTAEALALGWDEYVEAGGVCVIEWADKFPHLLPPHARWWRLEFLAHGGRQAVELSQGENDPRH